MTSIQSVVQSAQPGALVTLFRIDTSSIGGPVMYFCKSARPAGNVRFGGVNYTATDCEFSGFEVSGTGVLPQPKLRMANTNGVLQDIVNTYGDLIGCPVSRVRTFDRYLDDGAEPDASAFIGPDIFRVEQLTSANAEFLEWTLSASIDQEGKNLPGRLVLRDVCPWRYRSFDPATGDFRYSSLDSACPYAGAAMFDRQGKPVADKVKDVCGLRLSDCQARYGKNVGLPFGGFPGVARVRA